jgi:hypothetical protein
MNKVSNWVFGLVFGPLIALLLFSVQTLNIPLIWVACIGLLASLLFARRTPLSSRER